MFKNRLLNTVAIPVLSMAVLAKPVMASTINYSQTKSQSRQAEDGLIQLAQAVVCSDGAEAADQDACNARDAQRAAEQEAARQAAEAQAAAEEAQRAADEEAARQAAEQQAQQEAQKAAEEQAAQQAAAEEAQRAAEAEAQAAAEEAARQAAEQQAQQEAQKAAEDQAAQQAAAEEAQRAEAEAQAQAQAAAEAQAAQQAAEEEAARKAAEEQAAQQQAEQPSAEPAAEMVTCADGSQAATAEACPASEAAPEAEQPAAEQAPAEQPQAEEAPAAQTPAETAPAETAPAEQPAGEPAQTPVPATETPAEVPAETPAGQTTGEAAPAEQPAAEQVLVPAVEPPVDQPVPELVETQTEEQKQEIAADPSQTTETVVLPVEGGAAVLDSDKDADNVGGAQSRDLRNQQRAAEEVAPAPENDAAAQAEGVQVESQAIQATVAETGTKLDAAPAFAVPTSVTNNATNITNNVTNNNITNNTIIQNNVVNQVTEVKVIEQIDDRTIINVGNQIVVRGDDRQRLRYDSEETFYEELSRGRTRETIVRPNGSRLVTIYNRYGDIVLRSRITREGEEYVMMYSPEADDERPQVFVDVGYSLPPMRLTIPVQDYIVSTSREPDRDYYDFLGQPPVERVERVYSIDEVKSSARLRDKVRRIDLDTITFPSGSAEVPLAQAKTLRQVAAAMEQLLEKDPGEVFLIEGHTDAVGSDRTNLVLSDQRAETVANLLTEVYGIPPENMSVQGYGERYLKIRTEAGEQQNRRVAIRRVTSLVRPAVAANR
ncbi:OmpA/MotB domain protein [Rhizobium sp. PDO1-076]|uniref:OmpA family protein n=1 Tax=Rhizobium sp. PDO1-076 TaxID=1125979 RepID=UPI00024E2460|nr:OmpA family protein [Rhizobium sp. PDO1-076]EHS48796.1 OmpA/MotB domain protein [Rhizobium sp. PDO1-076]